MGMWMRRAYSGYKLLGRLARLTKGMPKKAAVISGRGHLVPATCMRNAKCENAKMQNAKCKMRVAKCEAEKCRHKVLVGGRAISQPQSAVSG